MEGTGYSFPGSLLFLLEEIYQSPLSSLLLQIKQYVKDFGEERAAREAALFERQNLEWQNTEKDREIIALKQQLKVQAQQQVWYNKCVIQSIIVMCTPLV